MSLYKQLVLLIIILCIYHHNSEVLLKPKLSEGEEIGLVILPGAQISAEGYRPLAEAIQERITSKRVWVSIPDVFLDLPLSFLATRAINRAIQNLYSNGMNKKTKIYLAGHSLGGVAVGKYAQNKYENIKGLILLGSFLDRSTRGSSIKTPTIQIGGELDGLSRITRFAEEFYHRSLNQSSYILNDNPVFVVKGMNHMQFASGTIPRLVKMRDFKPEISESAAHSELANLINSFIINDQDFLNSYLKTTLELVHPIISAYELEGSLHFNRPAQKTCFKGACGEGSPWAVIAQGILGGKDIFEKEGFSLTITNEYVQLDSLPPLKVIHHPKLIVDSANPKNVTIETMSECSFDLLDKYVDAGFQSTSAYEIGSKFISRQCALRKGANHTNEETPFTLDTERDWCMEINTAAFDWAIQTAGNQTRQRYEQFGQKMKFMKDYVVKNGFSFTYFRLNMTENTSTGDLEVTSRTMMTPEDFPKIPIFAPEGSGCYHYCKNLSPARAMEWIYVDSLRKNYNILQ